MHDSQLTTDMEIRRTIDDGERIGVLAQYGIEEALDPRYKRLVRLLREHCNMSWAALTFVERDRQSFKARDGFDLQHTPRHISFCSVAMHLNQPLIVEDARHDTRFRHNPLVAGDPHIRFYAGIPLVSREGYPLGALCVIDMQPRTLFPTQLDLLTRARDWVRASLEQRRLLRTLASADGPAHVPSHLEQKLVKFAQLRADRAWSRIIDPVHLRPLPPHSQLAPSRPSRILAAMPAPCICSTQPAYGAN